jgi:hypothetical protein
MENAETDGRRYKMNKKQQDRYFAMKGYLHLAKVIMDRLIEEDMPDVEKKSITAAREHTINAIHQL